MKISAWRNKANDGHERFGIDKLLERHVMQIQLPGNRDHYAVVFLLAQCSIGANPQLAAQHAVEGMRSRTAALVTQLQSRHFAFEACLLLILSGYLLCEHLAQIHACNRNVSMVVARNILKYLI